MIIIGYEDLPCEKFVKIQNLEDIKNTNPNEIVWFESKEYSTKFALHCKENNIPYAVKIINIKDLVIYSNLCAKYILISEKYLAEQSQKIANEYFFDSKILYIINDEGSIENAAILGIDGVIFNKHLN